MRRRSCTRRRDISNVLSYGSKSTWVYNVWSRSIFFTFPSLRKIFFVLSFSESARCFNRNRQITQIIANIINEIDPKMIHSCVLSTPFDRFPPEGSSASETSGKPRELYEKNHSVQHFVYNSLDEANDSCKFRRIRSKYFARSQTNQSKNTEILENEMNNSTP